MKKQQTPLAKWAFLIWFFLILLITIGLFLFFNQRAQQTRIAPPQQTVIGWSVHWESTHPIWQNPTKENIKNAALQEITQAKQAGANALFVFPETQAGAFVRVPAFQALPALQKQDTIFSKVDAFEVLSSVAKENQFPLFAVLTGDLNNHFYQQGIAQIAHHYPISGIYWYDSSSSQLLSIKQAFASKNIAPLPGAAFAPKSPLLYLAQTDDLTQHNLIGFLAQGGSGAVLAQQAKTDLQKRPMYIKALQSSYPSVSDFTIPGVLQITSPLPVESVIETTKSKIFLSGTSDPAEPLFFQGKPVTRWGAKGMFGIFLNDLPHGDTTITLSQPNQAPLQIIVRRIQPPPVSEPPALNRPVSQEPHDDTIQVEKGTFIQLNNTITTLLYNPSHDGNINETLRKGAIGRVVDSAETERKGKKTWAYQLASGDWVLASHATILETPPAPSHFTGANAKVLTPIQNEFLFPASLPYLDTNNTRTEELTFLGTGTPIAYTNQIENTLSLRFYDTTIDPNFSVQGSALVTGVEVRPFEEGTELILSFEEPLWGHLISYENNTTTIRIKKAPMRSQRTDLPLLGTSVLLDAGHGAQDTGAVGAAGANAPLEKHVNLSAALACAHRLQQLGATVYLTRSDDSFFSLEQRNEMISNLYPDFFISLHQNSIPSTSDGNNAFGTEAYYFYPMGKSFAQSLVNQITTSFGRKNRGAQWSYYYVTRNTMAPSVLLELGFLSNPAEYESLSDNTALWQTADAVARAILEQVRA